LSTNNRHAERLDNQCADAVTAAAGLAFADVWPSFLSTTAPKERVSEPDAIDIPPLAELENPDYKGLAFKGNITTTDDWGRPTTALADGGKILEDSDGRSHITTHPHGEDPGGTYLVVGKPEKSDDGTVTVKLADHPLDEKQVYRTDGVVEHWKKNGDQVVDFPNSTKRLVVSQDGTRTLEDTQDRSFQRTYANGEAIYVDGTGHKTTLVKHQDAADGAKANDREEDCFDKLANWIRSF